MGGEPKESAGTPHLLEIKSFNSLQAHTVDPDAVSRTNAALTRVVTTSFKSPLTRILIDTVLA